MIVEENPFKDQVCAVFLKSSIIFKGKITAGMYIETQILSVFNRGVTVEGNTFITWNNINAVCPIGDLRG
jgi:predicted Zn-dependent protease